MTKHLTQKQIQSIRYRIKDYLPDELQLEVDYIHNMAQNTHNVEQQNTKLQAEVERRGNLLEDVINQLDLSDSMIEQHGPFGTEPALMVRQVLDQKDQCIAMLKAGIIDVRSQPSTQKERLCERIECQYDQAPHWADLDAEPEDITEQAQTIIDKLRSIDFIGQWTVDHGEIIFRYDTGDCTPKENWDVYCDLVDDLSKAGLEIDEPHIEHDCISGNIVISLD